MSAGVIISYSSKDAGTANAACEALENAGLTCWIAPRDIAAGDDYQKAIIEAIDRARLIVVILTPSAQESPHVRAEIHHAFNKKVPILPFRTQSFDLEEGFSYMLGNRHWLDATSIPPDAANAQLVRDVGSILFGVPAKDRSSGKNDSTQAVPSGGRGGNAISLIALVVCLAAILALLYARLGKVDATGGVLASASGGPKTAESPTIIGTHDPRLPTAVGRLVTGFILTDQNGNRSEIPKLTATCFVIADSGYILTCRHNVKESESDNKFVESIRKSTAEKKLTLTEGMWVFFGRNKLVAKLRYQSNTLDYAVIKVNSPWPLTPLRLSAHAEVVRGSAVRAIGYMNLPGPFTELKKIDEKAGIEGQMEDWAYDYGITQGNVIVVQRKGAEVNLMHSAKLVPGCSGAPLLAENGTVIGLNQGILQSSRGLDGQFIALDINCIKEELMRDVPEIGLK